VSLKNKEKLVEELNEQLHETWEATPGNPFLEIPYGCLDVEKIMSAEITAELDFEIVNEIINKAKSMSKGFTNFREREEDFANAALGKPPIIRGNPAEFKWSEIQGLK
jgi:hypothetical protein